jgi:hypothetical protein
VDRVQAQADSVSHACRWHPGLPSLTAAQVRPAFVVEVAYVEPGNFATNVIVLNVHLVVSTVTG